VNFVAAKGGAAERDVAAESLLAGEGSFLFPVETYGTDPDDSVSEFPAHRHPTEGHDEAPQSAEETVRDTRRATRRQFSAEEKFRIYIWADGIHLEARHEDDKQCILVIIGTTPEGRKELVGFIDGARESTHHWRDPLLDLKRRGLDVAPELMIADGALGFWKAAGEVWPKACE
jgi:hypothetical protein